MHPFFFSDAIIPLLYRIGVDGVIDFFSIIVIGDLLSAPAVCGQARRACAIDRRGVNF